MLPLPTRRDYLEAHRRAMGQARGAQRPRDAAAWLEIAAIKRRQYVACPTEAQRRHIDQMLRQQLQA